MIHEAAGLWRYHVWGGSLLRVKTLPKRRRALRTLVEAVKFFYVSVKDSGPHVNTGGYAPRGKR